MPSTIVILGTGGTIAGTASNPLDNVGYSAAQRSVADLLAAVPALAGQPLAQVQVAQLDSKDMDHATWATLARAVQLQLDEPEVAGVVITHGTDTLEETAFFLQQVLAPTKPVVITAAMRPATALLADGPQNLLDAVTLARDGAAQGVLVVLAGQVHEAAAVRKRHTYRLDAFGSGEAGPLAQVLEGRVRWHRPPPGVVATPLGLTALPGPQAPAEAWPWVAIVTSHAGADGRQVRALCAAGVQGLVVAATGNGTVHRVLQAALDEAGAAGVPVWRCTRCADGQLVAPGGGEAGPAAAMSPWQARVALMLSLLRQRAHGAG